MFRSHFKGTVHSDGVSGAMRVTAGDNYLMEVNLVQTRGAGPSALEAIAHFY